jgi:hypothetical protein
MHYSLNLERFKIHIKIPTKYRSYMFRSTTVIRELVLSLAKVILKHSVKLRRYMLFGGVAACRRAECVLCVVQNETESGGVFCVNLNVNLNLPNFNK